MLKVSSRLGYLSTAYVDKHDFLGQDKRVIKKSLYHGMDFFITS